MSVRILVCDDEAHIIRAVSMKLKRAGYEIEAAEDGQAGLEAARENPPNLLITDCQMPRMSGLELCHHLREEPATSDLPIIMLTAKGFEIDEATVRAELGISQIMAKPFSPRELLKIVQNLLGEGSASDAAKATAQPATFQ